MQPRSTKIWIAAMSALISFLITVVTCYLLISLALYVVYGGRNPNDASVGDAVGWVLVIGAPVFIPFVLVVSTIVAVWSYRSVRGAGERER